MFRGINLLNSNSIFVKNFINKSCSRIFFILFNNKYSFLNDVCLLNSYDFIYKKLFFFSVPHSFVLYNYFIKFSLLIFNLKFFIFRIFKAHGINMRLIKLKNFAFFLRPGFSHGFFFFNSNTLQLKIFKKRYFIVLGYQQEFFENFSYQLRFLRRFFKYKLIGIKAQRDIFKIKIGKKKSF
jgi:hypothetical protein